MNQKNKKSKGFTLVELIVVMAGFLLIMAIAIVIFISIIQSQRKILMQNQLLNQTSYLIEYMSKGLRMAERDIAGSCLVYVDAGGEVVDFFPGYNYLYTKPNGGFYGGLKFINANSSFCQEFYLDSEDNLIKELKNSINEINAVQLISDKFDVDYFRIAVNETNGAVGEGEILGSSIDDQRQPRVTISAGFSVPGDNGNPSLKIQTTISQRNINE
jgi:type II secretory pathway pseudopilin PulG